MFLEQAIIISLVFYHAWGQGEIEFDPVIDAIFNKNSSNYINLTENCTCVPFGRCKQIVGERIIDIRSDGVCSDYLKVCCKKSDLIDEPIVRSPATKASCGQSNPDGVGFRLLGKIEEAEFGELPWMVALLQEQTVDGKKSDAYIGGGSLIHPQVVLTGAYTVFGKNRQQLKIRAGDWDSQTTNELLPHQDRKVSSVTVHPQYDNRHLYNDIALLFLESPVEIEQNVNVVCLPPQNVIADGAECHASGWGKDVFGKKGQRQVILKKIRLPIVRRIPCQDALRKTWLGESFELHHSFVCAGGEEGSDTCTGDGGGPLVCKIGGQTDRYWQTGIVAWGLGCGKKNIPGVYADVASFRNWIDAQLAAKNLDTKTYQY